MGAFQRIDAGFDLWREGAGKRALIIVQEIFGVNDFIKGNAEFFAKQGFNVVAPDLFWRDERQLALGIKERDRAVELMQNYDWAAGLADIQATIGHLHEDGAEEVYLLGFCMGGAVAAIAAAHCELTACASYYGVRMLERLSGALPRAPLLLHLAEKDGHVPPEAQKALRDNFADQPHIRILSHPHRDHAFCRPSGEAYDAASAEMAHAATLAWFGMHRGAK